MGMLGSYPEVTMGVRRVAVTIPEELYDMVERARSVEHRSRSEIAQEALRTYFGVPTYRPTDEEGAALVAALDDARSKPESVQDWSAVRAGLPGHR